MGSANKGWRRNLQYARAEPLSSSQRTRSRFLDSTAAAGDSSVVRGQLVRHETARA